jgi:hypothetical protein
VPSSPVPPCSEARAGPRPRALIIVLISAALASYRRQEGGLVGELEHARVPGPDNEGYGVMSYVVSQRAREIGTLEPREREELLAFLPTL